MSAARTAPTRRPSSAVDTPELALPKGCTSFKLRQLARRVGRHYDQQVAAVGLKTTQYSLLSHIAQLGPVRPSDLAARMALEPSTLTRNLAPLVAQGWVEVLAGEDGRSRNVILTPAGRVKRNEAQRAWKQAQLALNQRLGVDRVASLHALIDACLADLDPPCGDAHDEPDA